MLRGNFVHQFKANNSFGRTIPDSGFVCLGIDQLRANIYAEYPKKCQTFPFFEFYCLDVILVCIKVSLAKKVGLLLSITSTICNVLCVGPQTRRRPCTASGSTVDFIAARLDGFDGERNTAPV